MLLNHDEWLRQILLQRFDELSHLVGCMPENACLRMDLNSAQKEVKRAMKESDHGKLIELLDMVTRLDAMEKEWIYLKGVQDGVKLMIFQQNLETNIF